jgi:glycosyltransferase involved in cell wall biosynthesis
VIPCYNEERALDPLLDEIDKLVSHSPQYRFEVVFVNDGSSDGTLARLIDAQRQRPGLVIVDLSRNFGKEAALSAGLSVATGDAIVPLDADLQDPPDLVLRMLELWEQGNEVVVAKRTDRTSDSVLKRVSARWFYRVHNALSDVAIPHDVGDFRLMDRVVVDAVRQLPENRLFMKGLFAWIGFRTATVPYVRAPRTSGTTRFNAWRLWNLALEGITSFSLLPLRVWTYVGATVALASLVWGAFIVFRTIFLGKDLPGYPSLMVAVLLLGGLQLIGIGVVGEYLGRTYMESKRRPAFVIRKVFGASGAA